jgi:steroid 5-alpha reductase family enzyme
MTFEPAWIQGLPAALGLVSVIWLASLVRRDASIIDIFWGPGFALLAWIYAVAGGGGSYRSWLVPALVSLWGLRLGLHILLRSRGKGEDYRYAEMRERHGVRFPWVSLVTVFALQGVLMWLISAPLAHAAAGPGRPLLDGVALALFAFGFLFEAVGDWQLTRFRADPANRGRVMRGGLWRYTRHPNYFGDAVVWWSFFLLALAAPGAWWTVFAPLLMTLLLLKVSGVGLLEKKLARTREGYADYVRRTNAFLPWFPKP